MPLTGTGGGSLVTVNFHVLSNAPLGNSTIDLAADTNGGLPTTFISDAVDDVSGELGYNLIPAPQDNTIQIPYSYTGPDPVDGIVSVTGNNLAPVPVADSYSITERAVSSDPSLAPPASIGLLANDTDPQNSPLTASLVGGPLTAHGSVTVNSDGSFVYTPDTGYLGADTFTYRATDGFGLSNTANVTITVTSRLSIPTTLTGAQGGVVTVPVNLDNPNPAGSGGLIGASLAIDYDPTVFTFAGVQAGAGYTTGAGWTLNSTDNQPSGLLGISLVNQSGTPNTSTVAGNLVLITFDINSTASVASSPINLVPSNTPASITVTTSLTAKNPSYQMPPRPLPTNASDDVGVDGAVNVLATHFVVSTSGTVTAGAGFALTVTAEDSNNSTVTSYLGTVAFSSSDASSLVSLPASTTLVSGTGTFSATLITAANQTLTASDTLNSSVTGNSGNILVKAATATHFAVAAPSLATAGTGLSFTVTAQDQFNNTVQAYTGTVAFFSTDFGASTVLPAAHALTNGVGTFGATLTTAGSQTLIAMDNNTSSITGASGTITVSPLAVTHLAVIAPTVAFAGTRFTFTVLAEDQYNNTATSYGGTVALSSNDTGATLPVNKQLISGAGVFSATLITSGNRTITATDTVASSLTGASGTIAVSAATATHLFLTAQTAATAGSRLQSHRDGPGPVQQHRYQLRRCGAVYHHRSACCSIAHAQSLYLRNGRQWSARFQSRCRTCHVGHHSDCHRLRREQHGHYPRHNRSNHR